MRRKIYIGGLALVILINILAWNSPSFCDWHIKHVLPVIMNTYGRLTSLLPFSAGEIMLVLAVLLTVFGIVFSFWSLVRRNKYKKALKLYWGAYAWIFWAVCWIMTLNCSIFYHAPDFEQRYLTYGGGKNGSSAVGGNNENNKKMYSNEELAALRDYIVLRCNELAPAFTRDEYGYIIYDKDLFSLSQKAMQSLGTEYALLAGYYVTPKYLKMSAFFTQQNIMGYYFPFSMEANINSMMYIANVPVTVCHELAHTKGFLNEDDANMIGYLACIKSDDKFMQYSGYLSVLNYVNNEFYYSIGKDAAVYKNHAQISSMVSHDNIFLTPAENAKVEQRAVIKTETVREASNMFTDTVLKLNGVEEGRKQYDGVVSLLLQYYDGELY